MASLNKNQISMKTVTIGELKARFSELLKEVQEGEEIEVAFGKRKEVVAYLVPKSYKKSTPRKLGILQHKGKVRFAEDFKMTEEEFLGA
jgi:prevent-host-death family protein